MNSIIWGIIGTIVGSFVDASAIIITTLINVRYSANSKKFRKEQKGKTFGYSIVIY